MKSVSMLRNIMAVAAIGMGASLPTHAATITSSARQGQDASNSAPGTNSKTKQNKPVDKPLNLGSVVVTASSANLSELDSSVSVSTLAQNQIQSSGARNTADILRNIPGIRAEASGGAGNANISVRGLPEATGGGKFVQFQLNGMPVLEFGDIAFATPDTFLRPDLNISEVQVVRGGSTSVFASNAPGAVFNFITKTGLRKGGELRLTSGVGFDRQRVDFDYGEPLSNSTRFHVGGFWHQGQSPKHIGYKATFGGQLLGNVTHDIDGGFLRLRFEYLNDHQPVFLPVPLSITGTNSDPKVSSLPGFSVQHGALQSPYFRRDLAIDAEGNRVVTDIADGYHSKVQAFGGEGKFSLGDDWKLHEQFRVASNSGSFTGPDSAQVDTAANLARDIGGSGASLRYATGPTAGQRVDPASVGGNGLAQKTLLFNVSLPNMDNLTNKLTLKRDFDLDLGSLNVLLGYYHSHQNIVQDWHWNQYVQSVQGKDSVLLDVFNAGGTAITDDGLQAYGQPAFGNCCTRSYDAHYSMDAPYFSLNWRWDNWSIDGGLRYDHMNAGGTYASADAATLDVNQDGVIQTPEKSVQVVNNNNAKPINYTKDNVEYSVGANYSFTNNLAVFARASRGSRFNADRLLFGGGILPDGKTRKGVAVDEVKQYEGGVKWSTLHTSLFATAFYATTQEQNQDVTSTVSKEISREYRSYGLELEGALYLGHFTMRAGTTYTHSRITADAITPDDVGDVPKRQARWIYQLNPRYSIGPFTAGATVIGTTKSYASNPNGLIMPGYTQVNLLGRYDLTDDMTLSLHVDNVFNTIGLTEVDEHPINVQANGLNTARSILGRTIYASWQYQF